jgi:hypothetical protein
MKGKNSPKINTDRKSKIKKFISPHLLRKNNLYNKGIKKTLKFTRPPGEFKLSEDREKLYPRWPQGR